MAKRAKASEPSEPEAGIVKVDEPSSSEDASVEMDEKPKALPAPVVESRSTPVSEPSGPTFGQRVGGFLRFLLRVVSLLILLSLLSLALYLVLPWLYQKFITPVEQNTAQVRELQSQQKQMEQEMAELQTRLNTIATAQNGHDGSLTELDQRLSDIETEITARKKSLTALEGMQAKLESQNEANAAELNRQINLLKSMELLSRARLSMYQSNFGLAKQDVQIARDLLATLQPDAPESLGDELDAIVQRLDMVLSNLPNFPVAASDDLDIAWQILLAGLPQATPTSIKTPTPATTLSATPNTTFTPTPVGTVLPSATP
jgi:hypothetical protein